MKKPTPTAVFRFLVPLILLAGTLFAAFSKPVKIESGFYSLLPLSQNSETKRAAIEKISGNAASLVYVIFTADETVPAETLAAKQKTFAAAVDKNDFVPDGFAGAPAETLKKAADIFKPARFQLLSESQAKMLENGETDKLAENALAEIHSPVRARILPVKEDPYGFLTHFFTENPLLQTRFTFINGVPTAKLPDGGNAACLFLRAKNADSLSLLIDAVEKLKSLQKQFSDETVSVRLAGVPVHTADSASKSLHEINVLSLVSLALLFGLFLFVFRSLKTFFTGILTLGAAGTAAFFLTNAVFGEIHTLALVFGCSLLGIAVDCILHLVIAGTLTKQLTKALVFSAGTTCLAFTVFLFAQIGLLQQIAVFTITGILCTLALTLSVLAGCDRLKKSFPRERALKISQTFADKLARAGTLKVRICIFSTLFAAGTIAALSGTHSEDLKKLYEPSPELRRAETIWAQISGFAGTKNFLASATDETELLEKTAAFADAAALEFPEAKIADITRLVPAASRQKRHFELVKKLFESPPEKFPVKIKNPPENFEPLMPSAVLASGAFDSLSMLFGSCGNVFYAIVPVSGAIDGGALEKLAEKQGLENLDFVGETNRFLEKCRERTALLLLAAVAGTALLFAIFRGFLRGLTMILPTSGAIAGTLALAVACGVSVSFFHLLAFFLIFGFGVDYVIHLEENRPRSRESSLAILLSCATTFTAFGLLAFTAFPLTRETGILVAAGIALSYLLSNLTAEKPNR